MAETREGLSKLIPVITKHVNKICVISYVLGVIVFLALPYRDFSEHHYHSENALLTGLQAPNYGPPQQKTADLINKEAAKIRKKGKRELQDYLMFIMKENGITAYMQDFSFTSPLPTASDTGVINEVHNGTNVYGFIRAGRAASTESIVLNVPIFNNKLNYAVGLALAFGGQVRSQPSWAKDIVLLFSDMGYVGSQAWLQSYYSVQHSDFIKANPLQKRAGAILAALNLETPKYPAYINTEVVGNKGQLPNLDLFNVIKKLSYQNGVYLAVGGILNRNLADPAESYKDSLTMTIKMMSKQAKGFTDINHATFLQHNIQSLTIQGVASDSYPRLEVVRIGRIVEGAARSLNNLLEKLHHSYFFYLISAPDGFISIVLYMPPLGLILLSPALKALVLWLQHAKSSENDEKVEQEEDEDDKFIRKMRMQEKAMLENQSELLQESPWLAVFYKVAVAELLGVMLYFSPRFSTAWSAMYGFEIENSLMVIFISTYAVAMLLPFNSILGFTEKQKSDYEVLNLLRIVALLLFCIIVGCTAVMNFSLGMIIAVASVPFITPINPQWKRLKPLNMLLVLLASPIIISLIYSYAEIYIFNGSFSSFKSLVQNLLQKAYEQSLLGNSWNYEWACLLIYPNWMLFWCLALA